MAHARNFSDRHAFDMQSACRARKGGQSQDHLVSPAPLAAGLKLRPPTVIGCRFGGLLADYRA
jgi:hypothetical protein